MRYGYSDRVGDGGKALEAIADNVWRARLRLRFQARAGRTVLAERAHHGPLRLLKPLYPEGDDLCHAVLVHPPGGLVGGDQLHIDLGLEPDARVLVTTPGAQKWYRSAGAAAVAETTLRVSDGAALEWMPQESMLYCGAVGTQDMQVEVSENGAFWGWELLCAGRSARGERFSRGQFSQHIAIRRNGRLLWLERMVLEGDDPLLASVHGLHEQPVMATAWLLLPAALLPQTSTLLAQLRETLSSQAACAAAASSPVEGLIVLKAVGDCAEAVRNLLIAAWMQIRWPVFSRLPVPPRLWST